MKRWGGLVVLGAKVGQDLFTVNCCCHGQLFFVCQQAELLSIDHFHTHAIPERSSRVLRSLDSLCTCWLIPIQTT